MIIRDKSSPTQIGELCVYRKALSFRGGKTAEESYSAYFVVSIIPFRYIISEKELIKIPRYARDDIFSAV